ncbi:hypothetical protein ACRE_041120 [Hapsidospora chrysogenum ATCC 11550]|uniref:Mei5 protein n=1 Tax=Hapsidospora chrysogenum (strain ATCC 11550 / CBS 779.69 / DSM 880 / IAM 14645 / JCM 23072 / IMI 49137) TaxID=857340 RepID=A0A086T6Q6_HAPC1|nr:hypothetical protein ACRE_041120 [Hapsidospora chrysogenum ATCC 11550]
MPSARVTAPPVTATKLPSNSSHPKTNGLNDSEDAVNGFIALVTNYCANGGYEKLKGLLKDHEALKKTLNDKEIANQENLKSIASLTQDVKNNEVQLSRSKHEVGALTKELEDLKANNRKQSGQLQQSRKDMSQLLEDFKEKEAEVQRHHDSISELEKSTKEYEQEVEALKASLEAEKKTLSAQNDKIQALKGRLEQLESFSIQMVDCTTIQETGNASLGSIFDAAYKLMESFLFQDVAQATLNKFPLDAPTKIPLPASNTLPARQMRLATGLAVLGHALGRHIFQPLYISEDKDGLTASMAKVLDDNPELETHARGVVLNLLDDDILVAKGQARAQKAAMEVSRNVKTLLPAKMGDSFDKNLQLFCNQALETWLPLQRVADRVMVEFSYTESSEEWKELPIPSGTTTNNGQIDGSSSAKQAKNTSRHSNGSSSSSQPGPSGQRGSAPGGSSQGQSSIPRPASSNLGNHVYKVWPAIIVNDDDVTLLHHGFFLTEEQVKEAREEVAKGETERRENRMRTRRNTDANRTRSSTSFLA